MSMEYDVVIIGSGPAGYVAAIRAGQLGLKTALLEKESLGGMCLNWGCIPTKSLIESAKFYEKAKTASNLGVDGIEPMKLIFNWEKAVKRSRKIVQKLNRGIDSLLKKNGVDFIKGEAEITSPNQVSIQNRSLDAKNIIIATGTFPAEIPGNLSKVDYASLNEIVNLESVPDRIAIFGYGPVSLELAQFFRMTDKEVSLINPGKELLPNVSAYLNDFALNKMKSVGIKYIVEAIPENKQGEDIVLSNGEHIKADILINANWRKAVMPPSALNFEFTDEGYLKVDDDLRTNFENIFAIGDVNGLSYLAHVASAQGIFAVNKIKGVKEKINLSNYPVNIYSVPEMSQIGQTEKDLDEKGIDYKISEFPLTANGKAMIEGQKEGMVRILHEKKYGEVLGVQIIADHATDMIAEAAAFMSVESTVYDVSQTIHAHPTVSEVFMEAGMEGFGQAIHK